MVDILGIIGRYGTGIVNRLYGCRIGTVLDNDDPTHQGIIQVSMVGTAVTSDLRVLARPLCIGGGRGFGFKMPLPPRGSMVNLLFIDGDPGMPLWAYSGWQPGEAPSELDDPETYGIVTPAFNHILISKTSDGKERLDIKFDGPINISSTDSVNISSPCNSLEPTESGFNSLGTGENDGWAVAEKLTQRLNQLVAEIEQLKTEIATHTHMMPTTDTPTSPPVAPLVTNISKFNSLSYVDPNNIS